MKTSLKSANQGIKMMNKEMKCTSDMKCHMDKCMKDMKCKMPNCTKDMKNC